MFKSKLEVDRHVHNCLKKINNETERNLRSFSFGKLYYTVGDYEQANRYINSYLSVKPKSSEGYALLGKSLEKLGKLDAALEAYRNSLQIDPKQNTLVIKVCELMSTDNVEMDLSGARYFCDLAQTFDPDNPAVYSLKEKLITKENENPVKITQLLLQELEIRPSDINLRIRLLKHFIQNNMIGEAYKHACDIEEKNISIFYNNLSWYENFADILSRYQKERSGSKLTYEYWLQAVSVLERLVALSLEEYHKDVRSPTDYVAGIFNLDQMLYKAHQSMNCADHNLQSIFFKHYHAQLYFHLSTVIFKQNKRDKIRLKEASNVVLPLLFTAYHANPPDLNSVWFVQSPENIKRLIYRWYQMASYRCSQVGHILLVAAKDRNSLLLEKAAQYSSGLWREQLFKKVFVRRDQHLNITSSFFIMNDICIEPTITLPNSAQLMQYDEVAQFVYPDSLHHYIWLALNSKIPVMNIKTFEGMQYSTTNLLNCAAESLNLLDVYSFVYCSSLCASVGLTDNKQTYNILMPASITENLATFTQSKFLESAYKMYKNEQSSHLADIRVLLIRGIEVVRCIGHHGLDVRLLIAMANIFEERVKVLDKQTDIDYTLARTEVYWKAAIPLLEKIMNNEMIMDSTNKIFDYKANKLTSSEAKLSLDKGKLFMGTQMKKKREFEKALTIFDELKDPYASFYQYEIYKHFADTKKRGIGENCSPDGNQYKALLTKARDCLYLTLDRLRVPSVDADHPLNSQLSTGILNIEQLLSGIGNDGKQWNDPNETPDNYFSLDTSIEEQYLSNLNTQSFYETKSATKNEHRNIHSTPLKFNLSRQEVRPSPERLDAQIRQIMTSRDTSFAVVAEQNKTIVEAQKNLLEKLNFVVDDLKSIKKEIENLKEVTKSIDEIKNSTEDFQNVVDVIQEIKKDLIEVKKNNSKSNQLSDEDLYLLDPDYGADFNITPNISATYPNYPAGRIPNPTHIPPYGPMMYSGLYPNSPYAYVGLNFAQPGAVPFIPEQASTIAQSLAPNLVHAQPSLPQTFAGNIKFGADIRNGQEPSSINQSNQHAKDDIAAATPKITPIKPPAVSTTLVPTFSKSAPVNVVITNSDPLPNKNVVLSQPVLSVTIPPQHVKSNFMKPASSSSTSVVNESSFMKPDIQNKLIANSDTVNTKSLSVNPLENTGSKLNFKPIFALHQEPPVYAWEENENELFSAHVKLFVQVSTSGNKEWKEKGAGTLKISKNRDDGKSRISMKRDHDYKICANHLIRRDMALVVMNNEKAVTWLAQDTSDGQKVPETFCAKFKTIEEVKKFSELFESGKESRVITEVTTPKQFFEKVVPTKDEKSTPQSNSSLGGFVFTGTPTFKPKEVAQPVALPLSKDTPKASPFSAFIFGKDHSKTPEKTKTEALTFSPLVISQEKKSDETETVDDFVPTAEFKPVVPLPELVKIKTGEEDSEVLFDARTKLFRYDTKGDTKEWKERGVGNIKILKDNFIRLLMRRDQVHKVCCNHRVLKDMIFKSSSSNAKAVVWKAQDFSEGVLTDETFTARFKTDEIANQFLQILHDVQKSMDENNSLGTQQKVSTTLQPANFDNFRPAQGSWECKNCYIRNDGKSAKCMACNEAQAFETTEKKGEQSKIIGNSFSLPNSDKSAPGSTTNFAFGFNSKPSNEVKSETSVGGMANFSFSANVKQSNEVKPATGFGDAFKPKPNTWECKGCLIRNDSNALKCVACNSTKEGVLEQKSSVEGMANFSFGMNAGQSGNVKSSSGFGDAFKAKAGTWECKNCLIRNEADVPNCMACKSPKEDGLKQKSSVGGTANFSFGVNSKQSNEVKSDSGFGDAFKAKSGTWECKICLIRNEADVPNCMACQSPREGDSKQPTSQGINLNVGESKWTFGIPSAAAPSNILNQTPDKQILNVSSSDTVKPLNTSGFLFGSAQRGEFEFKQRSPRRISTGQDNESDGNYVEEEEEDNIYFKPVIPLPDKIQVKTGEEDEDVLFCHRSKLYRFINGEWKERGVGDVKILRNKASQKLRVLMRRDQVHKICLNHLLTKDIEYKKKDEKSLLFATADFSEEEIAHEKFCLRFKNSEIADAFQEAVKGALQGSGDKINENPVQAEEELQFVSETEVTPEEEQAAVRLGLPPKFLSYKQLPDCVCEQCKKDDEYLKDLFNNETKNSSSDVKLTPSISTPSSIFGFSSKNTNLFSSSFKDANQSKDSEKSNQFSLKPPLLVSPTTLTKTESKTTFTFSCPVTTTSSLSTTFSFGNSFTSNSSIFADSSNSFAGKSFGNNSTVSFGSTNLFGSLSGKGKPFTFEAKPTVDFSNSSGVGEQKSDGSTNIFANKTFDTTTADDSKKNDDNTISSTSKLSDTEELVLKCDSDLSFASLAAATSSDAKPAFTKTGEPFSFLGAGAPVFGSLKTKSSVADTSHAESEEDTTHNEEYDPHYEPIVPLPDAIVVTTGEENETVLFNERAKLFRFDANTKEWKERGVGQFKILYHSEKNTYRLLLRREQVHKIVLNQLISANFELQPMSTSEKAWIWAGYNYTDDENSLEKLAVRFKTVELAHKFHTVIEDTIGKLQTSQSQTVEVPESVQNFTSESSYKDEDDTILSYDASGNDEDYDYGEEEEEEEERSIIFSKECRLSKLESNQWEEVGDGDLQVYYDPELYACRTQIIDDSGRVLSNTIIGINTVMDLNQNECTWKAVEWADNDAKMITLRASFDSEIGAQEFHSNYLESINYAQQVGLVDELPIEYETDRG